MKLSDAHAALRHAEVPRKPSRAPQVAPLREEVPVAATPVPGGLPDLCECGDLGAYFIAVMKGLPTYTLADAHGACGDVVFRDDRWWGVRDNRDGTSEQANRRTLQAVVDKLARIA